MDIDDVLPWAVVAMLGSLTGVVLLIIAMILGACGGV